MKTTKNKAIKVSKTSTSAKIGTSAKSTQTSMTSKANQNVRKAIEASKAASLNLSAPVDGPDENQKYMWLNNADLQISPRIQRRLDMKRVDEIEGNYSPLIANPIKVSFRDGKFYIFDGMHTRTATAKMQGTDNFPIFCRVYFGLTEEDEARLFAEQFGLSEDITMWYRLRALDVAKDEEVLDFKRVTRASGLAISLDRVVSGNGHISAVVAAFKAYRDLGGKEYCRMLKILYKTWAGESWSLNRYMLSGMARFMKMYEINISNFVKVFRGVTYQEIKTGALGFPGMTREGAFAAALAEIYGHNAASELKECG